jgi:DNA adenine methylase
MKTPLRYPGGKSRALKKLAEFYPDISKYKEFREPFLGGGSVSLYMTQMYPHLDIWVNDLYGHLYNFWKELQHNGKEIADELRQLKAKYNTPDKAKVLFLESKEYLSGTRTDSSSRAVSFYIINKCSFSGLTESSSFSKAASISNFSIRGIERLPEHQKIIQDWKITNLSYDQLLTDDQNTFVYLDPPYDIKVPIYGKRGEMHKHFNHEEFAEDCDRHTAHMMISYNSSQKLKNRFVDWNAYDFDLTYSMRTTGDYMKEQSKRKELVLTNYGIRQQLPSEGLSKLFEPDEGISAAA